MAINGGHAGTGKSCFSNRALVEAIFETPKLPLKIVFSRPTNLSRLKPYY